MRHTAYRLVALIPCVFLSLQCAARGPAVTSSQLSDLARADALVRDGCYRCLQEALRVYVRLTDPPAQRPLPRALRGAFDVSLLLAAREKEIGLPADASLARARALLSRMSPAQSGTHEDLSMRLAAAEAIVGEASGLDAEERQHRGAGAPQHDVGALTIQRLAQAFLESGQTDLIAAYLALGIDCGQPANRRLIPPASMLAQHGGPALMRYRVAICSSDPPTPLTRLREEDPRWTEIFFFEGKYEMGSPSRSPEPVRAAALLAAAAEALPASVAVHMLLAWAQEMNGDFAAALASFDRILATKPAHVDARLGRARNLSYLGRAEEGIAAATALIDHGTWHVGDAYYWRAWNHYQAHRLEPAWADVQEALRLLANTSVYSLAGSIAYALRDLDTAVRHFDSAVKMDPTNCVAASSAGLVQIDLKAWQMAADRFSKATNCYALVAGSVRTELAALERAALDPALKARRLSSARKRLESAEDLGSQSALNAAQSYVHAGDTDSALTYVERAERHPATRDKAQDLEERIARVPRMP